MVKLLSILTMTLMAFVSAAGGERETAAESAALDWLTYLDAGEYVVLQFDSTFDNKVVSVETVTTVLENGDWRVIGYFIR